MNDEESASDSMWFKSRKTNRRFERDHVLDVKMRARQIRAARLRVAVKATGTVLITALTFGLLWFGSDWAMNEWLYRNPAFCIKRLEVQTDGAIPVDRIMQWAGVKAGDNLVAVDLGRIERDLKLQPLIQDAAAIRVFPDTLRIRVVEREPVAQISGFQMTASDAHITPTTYYIDPAGYVILPPDSARPTAAAAPGSDGLPVLTGVLGTELCPGRRAESAEIHSALRFIAAFDRSPMIDVVDLKTINLSLPPVLQVTTRQGNEIILGPEDFERQLRRWRVVHDYAAQVSKQIATLDLSVSNNVPVRWQDAGAPPPVPAKGLKPSRFKRKHV